MQITLTLSVCVIKVWNVRKIFRIICFRFDFFHLIPCESEVYYMNIWFHCLFNVWFGLKFLGSLPQTSYNKLLDLEAIFLGLICVTASRLEAAIFFSYFRKFCIELMSIGVMLHDKWLSLIKCSGWYSCGKWLAFTVLGAVGRTIGAWLFHWLSVSCITIRK